MKERCEYSDKDGRVWNAVTKRMVKCTCGCNGTGRIEQEEEEVENDSDIEQ